MDGENWMPPGNWFEHNNHYKNLTNMCKIKKLIRILKTNLHPGQLISGYIYPIAVTAPPSKRRQHTFNQDQAYGKDPK